MLTGKLGPASLQIGGWPCLRPFQKAGVVVTASNDSPIAIFVIRMLQPLLPIFEGCFWSKLSCKQCPELGGLLPGNFWKSCAGSCH
jgi:hypothetical protein